MVYYLTGMVHLNSFVFQVLLLLWYQICSFFPGGRSGLVVSE